MHHEYENKKNLRQLVIGKYERSKKKRERERERKETFRDCTHIYNINLL